MRARFCLTLCLVLSGALLGAAALTGCGSSDPAERVRKERARWTVQAFEWLQLDDGAIHIGTRVSGPPNSRIDSLTVRIDLLDDAGEPLDRHWHTFDLTQIQRGGPRDVPVRLPAMDRVVEAVSVQLVLDPTDEEAAKIVELQGL